jgi:hypothetical protein
MMMVMVVVVVVVMMMMMVVVMMTMMTAVTEHTLFISLGAFLGTFFFQLDVLGSHQKY